MQRHLISLIGVSLLLVGCGSMSNSNSAISTTATPGPGPVVISTDRTTYAPDATMVVTVQNTLSTPIYALDTRSSCSILALQHQVNGVWQPSQVATCPLGRPARPVKIDAGATYTANITAGFPGLKQATFPTGTYRLVLLYTTTPDGIPTDANGVTVTSARLQVQQSS